MERCAIESQFTLRVVEGPSAPFGGLQPVFEGPLSWKVSPLLQGGGGEKLKMA